MRMQALNPYFPPVPRISRSYVHDRQTHRHPQQVFDTIQKVSHNKQIFLFLLAFFLYIDGVHTIMAMASDFALNLDLPSSAIIVGLILVQFVAFPSTLMWAWLANKFSDRNILLVTIGLYLLIIAYSVNLSNAMEFYILASLVGSVQGGIQAISRSFFAKLIPHEKSGEYFGFFNMFGRWRFPCTSSWKRSVLRAFVPRAWRLMKVHLPNA